MQPINARSRRLNVQDPAGSLRILAGIFLLLVVGITFTSLSPYLKMAGVGLFTLVVLIQLGFNRPARASASWFELGLFALLLYQAVSLLWTPYPRPATERLAANLLLVIFFMFVRGSLRGRWTARNWLDALMLLAVVMVLIDLLLFANWLRSWRQISPGSLPPVGYRSSGLLFGHSNVMAAFLNLLLPIQFARTALAEGWKQRLGHAGLFLLLGFGLFLTSSRGGWLAGLIGLGVTAAILLLTTERLRSTLRLRAGDGSLDRRKLLLAILVMMLLLAIVLAGYWQVSRTGHASPLNARLPVWRGSMAVIGEAPLRGSGLGSFPSLFAAQPLDHHEEDIPHAHNILLQFWAEFGLVGLAALIAISALFLYPLISSFLGGSTTQRRRLAPMIGVLAAVLSHHLFDYLLGAGLLIAPLLVLLAILMEQHLSQSPALTPRFPVRNLLAPIALAAFVAIAVLQRSNWQHWEAIQAAEAGDWLESARLSCQNAARFPREALAHESCQLATTFARGELSQDPGALVLPVRLDPNWHRHWENLGILLFRAGDIAGAISAQRNAIQLAPHRAELYLGLGYMLEQAGQPAAGLDAYQQALDQSPAMLHSAILTQSEIAGPLREQAQKEFLDHPPNAFWLAQHSLDQADYQAAYDALSALAPAHSTNPNFYLLLAQAQLGLGQLQAAQHSLDVADFIRTPGMESTFIRWQLVERMGDPTSSDTLVEKWVDQVLYSTSSQRYYFAAYGRASLPADRQPFVLRGTITQQMAQQTAAWRAATTDPDLVATIDWIQASAGQGSSTAWR